MKVVSLGELMPSRIPSINPSAFPDEHFTLWSIPSYDTGKPELVLGRDVRSSKKTVQDGDVLLSKIVPHIRRAWKVSVSNGHRQIASSEWIIFRHDAFLSDYIRHFLLTDQFHRQFMGTVAGVGGSLLRAQPKSVAKIGIPLPPLEEQRRIVRLLDQAAEIKRRVDAARTKARAIIPALFLDMFGDPATNPKGWPTQTLGELADIGSGLTKGRKLNGTPTVPTPYLRVANVQADRLDLSEIKLIDATEGDRLKCRLEIGDLLMTEGGDSDKLGRCAMWRGEVDLCLHQNHVFRVRMAKSVIPDYARAFMQCEAARGYFLRVAKRTTGIASINKTQLSQLPVWVPPLPLQTAFADQAQRLEATARTLDSSAAKAEAMAAALSAEVFGRRRERGPGDGA